MADSIHDSDLDLAAATSLPSEPVLKVYELGPVTVVGFGGEDVPDEVCIAAYREQLLQLVQDQQCHTLAFDLTGVKLIPSGMLGVLVTLRKKVGRIELYNASEDIRSVLKLTNLDTMFEIQDLAL
ncbi:anti-sigma factor antagonist [bacterium]|nr:anti-sigma factor antagonist [bacterium]